MRKALVFGLSLSLLSGPALVLAEEDKSKEDKVEQERRKREEKSLQKDLKEEKQARQIMDEIQERVDTEVEVRLLSKYGDEFLQDYINELGQSLIPKETPSGVLFSFRVQRNGEPEAVAFPDGRIFVSTGLLCFVRNEAQLAVVLGHEIGHVLEKHTIEIIKESRSIKRRILPGILGAAAGALIGGAVKGKEGAAAGAVVGGAAGAVFSFIDFNRYNRKQEDEADLIGTRLALNAGFDAKEGPALFQHLAERFGDQDRLSSFIYASHSRNVDRVSHTRALLEGELAGLYNEQRSAGKLTLGGGQLQFFASAMIREAAIDYMTMDRYDLARELLLSIEDYRMRDPKTLWALGRLYKMVGRTGADKAKALDYLQRAVQLDERNLYPEIHRDLGLMQASLASSGGTSAAAVESLKKYIRGYMDRQSDPSPYPPDIEPMYDYLLVFGDSKWTAPRMEGAIVRVAPAPAPAGVAKSTAPLAPGAKAIIPAPEKRKP